MRFNGMKSTRLLVCCAATMIALAGLTATAATQYTVGGTVNGLKLKEFVTLLDTLPNKVTDQLAVTKDGSFHFAKELASGATYKVTVKIQPPGESCSVKNGAGTVGHADITDVTVDCVYVYTVGGKVSGLAAKESVTLLDNNSNALTVTANGVFTFSQALGHGARYDVTVERGKQPKNGTCTVTKGSGLIVLTDITTVKVTCVATPPPTYSIGGNVGGLDAGTSVVLEDGSTNTVTVTRDGPFTLPVKEKSGTAYDVTVKTQPTGETCGVNHASGTVGTSDITNVAVSCQPNTTATYGIGGMVSGLNTGASVVLQDNGADNLTVTSNGQFTFSTKLASQAQYKVTVETQPTGETCSVANGSGTVGTASVTNVSVSCTTNTGGGGSGIWLPFTATPVPDTTGGQTGLFVIPSGSIAASTAPAPQWVSTTAVQYLAEDIQFAFNGDSVTTYQPTLLVYAAADSNGNTHIYGLNLTATSAAPVAAQISNLSLPSTQVICSAKGFLNEVTDPTSGFLVVDVGPVNACGTNDTFEVVHYGDSSTTAPVTVSLSSTSLNEIYNNFSLVGMVEFDSASGDVLLYADDTFTSPKTLFTGVTSGETYSSGTSRFTGAGSILYNVTTSKGSTLYLLDSAGTSTQVFAGTISTHGTDDNNFYFVTSPAGPPANTAVIYQVPLGGGTPQELFSLLPNVPDTTPTIDLIGSNDSVLIFGVPNGSGASASTTLYNIPVGKTTSTPTTIGTYSGRVSAFLGLPASGGASGDALFVSNETGTTSASGIKYSWSSVAWPAAGPYTATLKDNSAYADLGLLSSTFGGVAWHVTGITDTSGEFGGGTLYQTDIGTLADTAVSTTGGGDYVLPGDYEPEVDGVSTSGIADGQFIYEGASQTGNPTFGVATDTTKAALLPLQLTNTDVKPLF